MAGRQFLIWRAARLGRHVHLQLWLLSIVGGWLWDLTKIPVASFAPVALCVVVVLASTVKNARQ
jgi:hypothetical protein